MTAAQSLQTHPKHSFGRVVMCMSVFSCGIYCLCGERNAICRYSSDDNNAYTTLDTTRNNFNDVSRPKRVKERNTLRLIWMIFVPEEYYELLLSLSLSRSLFLSSLISRILYVESVVFVFFFVHLIRLSSLYHARFCAALSLSK